MKKLISIILSVVLLFSILAVEASAALDPIYVKDEEGNENKEEIDYQSTLLQYLNAANEFKTDEAKLATMTLMYEKDGYQLYADEFTGEVATKNLATGQILFSNPRDIASKSAAYSNTTKYELMSQIVVKYLDNGTERYFYSFEQAAMNGQITVKNIKNGLRVEYTIGREDTKYLVPRLIEKERFETQILDVLLQGVMEKYGLDEKAAKQKLDYFKVISYYSMLKDPNNAATDRELAEMQLQYPITKKTYNGQLMAVYVCSAQTATELREIEDKIKTYCPKYTYEELDFDHALTEYVIDDRAPALFKMALEYRLDENGVTVRLPSNGIRFNEAEYQLSEITVLPWMGCGSNENTGYTFFPDGSGAIFRFEDLDAKKTHTINAQIYGQDYAYHTITGTNQEIVRYPVFGVVENKTVEHYNEETGVTTKDTVDTGYVAIVEEGESLAKLSLVHYGAVSKYNTVQLIVNPRPRDNYILSDAVSVGSNNSVTVISKRKYVGDYKVRYVMLTDDEVAKNSKVDSYYEASWVGMAAAYRDYLSSPYSTGTQNLPEDQQTTMLSRLEAEDVKSNIPLYIETFGAIDTIEKVLSIPVNTKAALTSFEDIQTMYDDLKEEGITNVNFRLTGYYNGGMYSAVPYRLNFEKAVGGKEGFEKLLADAKEEGYGVYLDFNFVYASMSATKLFDGLSNNRDLIKTIDDRYTSKAYYSAATQFYTSYFELAISPSRYEYFYDKVSQKYLEYNPIGISLSTLASELNTDFDEDEPYNREDSKKFTKDILAKIAKDYDNVLVDSANAYAWGYIDHMLNAATDSSRYTKASNSVPFLGVVLHGSVQFAGTPINMEGNVGYAMLKAIENGAGLYFILSYSNTELLKEDVIYNKYYSVRYDIWFDELVDRYTKVNDVLKDLQTNIIIDHDFLIGERIPDADEIIADKEAAEKLEQEKAEAEAEAARIEFINKLREGRFESYEEILSINTSLTERLNALSIDGGAFTAFKEAFAAANELGLIDEYYAKLTAYNAASAAYDAAKADPNTPADVLASLLAARGDANKALSNVRANKIIVTLRNTHTKLGENINSINSAIRSYEKALENVKFAYDHITANASDYKASVVADITARYNSACDMKVVLDEMISKFETEYKSDYYETMISIEPNQNYYKENTGSGNTGNSGNNNNNKVDKGYQYTKYTNDNGNIVAVTYGGKNGNDNDPYRTFILNYNYFSVTVEFEGETYTIPAFGYVSIDR